MQNTSIITSEPINLSDFVLFLSVMKNKTAYRNTLSIILDEPDIQIREVKVEQVVLNKSGKRAIRLDTPILKSGKKTKYRELPSTVIIFITQEDMTTKIFLNMTKRGLHRKKQME